MPQKKQSDKIAVTISPKQDLALLMRPVNQLAKYAQPLSQLLKSYNTYYGRPELTQQGMIHFHFYIDLSDPKDKTRWMKTTLWEIKKMGNTKVKVIYDKLDGWIEYINKEKEIYDNIFKNNLGIPINFVPGTLEKYLKTPVVDLDLYDNEGNNLLDQGVNKIIKTRIVKAKTIN